MAEPRVNVESNETMIRITTLDLTNPDDNIEFASHLARRMSGRVRVGLLGKFLRCLPRAVPISRSYRRKKRKLISDPRLRHILDLLIISIIRKVEEVGPSITSFNSIKEPIKPLDRSISGDKGRSLKSIDLEHKCTLTDNEDEDEDEDLDKLSPAPKKGKETSEGDIDCTSAQLIKEPQAIAITDSKDSVNSPKKEIQRKPENILEDRNCPICWEPYQVGQKVCWSPNKRCNHTFHADCMITWLMKKNDCPMCRSDYLRVDRRNS